MLRIDAPAKVNLTLHVTGRRADGYHLLDSLVAFAGTGDVLAAEPAEALSLTVDGPEAAALPPGDDNIVLKAARALRDRAGITTGAHLRLTKTLPVASGIGGGSTDAAAALRLLSRLWGLDRDLGELALSLGADVPVCLAGRPARMQGIGEIISPAPALPPGWLVLTNPRIPLATPAVFRARTGCYSDPAPLETTPRDAAHLAQLLKARTNDLAEAAIRLVPEIGEALALLAGQPACLLARMSGSGATCFGLFATRAEAEAAAAALTLARPSWWHAPAPLLA